MILTARRSELEVSKAVQTVAEGLRRCSAICYLVPCVTRVNLATGAREKAQLSQYLDATKCPIWSDPCSDKALRCRFPATVVITWRPTADVWYGSCRCRGHAQPMMRNVTDCGRAFRPRRNLGVLTSTWSQQPVLQFSVEIVS